MEQINISVQISVALANRTVWSPDLKDCSMKADLRWSGSFCFSKALLWACHLNILWILWMSFIFSDQSCSWGRGLDEKQPYGRSHNTWYGWPAIGRTKLRFFLNPCQKVYMSVDYVWLGSFKKNTKITTRPKLGQETRLHSRFRNVCGTTAVCITVVLPQLKPTLRFQEIRTEGHNHVPISD